ncbi:molybdopterin molybdotransferase MoeA [Leptolyngbya ohadii]|uniref:molybdopterin molybdotransferase MoeA n=1 Tax=Leptolyngbya ohadii TaxID=1962290 RepID=UPI000B59E08B|nr:gephyrin-like molybdotransferase Glp [Leptolyngbya ohadii]
MLTAQEAESLILQLTQPLDPKDDRETVDLSAAADRILAAPVSGTQDFPHWDNSAMDGYAVRYGDVAQGSTENPVTLDIVDEIPAGSTPKKTIQVGQAARIFTGSMLPPGADTIVMQEDTQREGDWVKILTSPKPQAFVRHRGAYYQAGQPLLQAGIRLSGADIAVLATAQCLQVPVYRSPNVAILSTGNELVSPGQPLQPGQIVDSNQAALAALVARTGAKPICLGIVPDQPEILKAKMAEAIASADLVLSSGGVSVGDYDYVDRILAELGAEIHVRSVAVKPGKPLTVATFPKANSNRPVLYFGLPGNPVSSLVSFWRFVQPALRKLSGLRDGWEPAIVQSKTLQDLRSDGKRESYVWGQVRLTKGEFSFEIAGGSQSSGNLINLAQTTGLAILPIGQTAIAAGESVSLLLVNGLG